MISQHNKIIFEKFVVWWDCKEYKKMNEESMKPNQNDLQLIKRSFLEEKKDYKTLTKFKKCCGIAALHTELSKFNF